MSGSNYQQNNKKNWNHATPWVRLLNNSQGVANVPIGRHWHTGNICQGYDGSQYFIIFGGYSTNAQTGHSDVWSLGLDMFNIWSEIQHKNSSSARSTARYSHTAAVLNDRQLNPDPPGVCNIYVFGGTTRSQTTLRQKDEKQLYQVQFVDLRTSITQPASVPRWTMYINEIKNHPAFVSDRASHSVVKIDHRMYIFGGVSGFMDSVTVHNDLWSYSIRTKSWRNEYNKPIQSVLPIGRFNHGAVLYKASSNSNSKHSSRDMYQNTVHMIIYGGQGLSSYTYSMQSDVWSVMLIGADGKEVDSIEWKQLLQPKDSIKRTDGVMIMWNSYVIYFAGMELTSSASFVYRDIFRTNVQNLIEADVGAKFEARPNECLQYPRKDYKVKCVDRQWARTFDEEAAKLERNEGYVLQVPKVRFGAAYAKVGNDKLIVHGGRFHYELDDTWSINLTNIDHWTSLKSYDDPSYSKRNWDDMCHEDIFSCPALWIFSTLSTCFLVAMLSYWFCIKTNARGDNRMFRDGRVMPLDAANRAGSTAVRQGVSNSRLESLDEIIHVKKQDKKDEKNIDKRSDDKVKQDDSQERCSICMEEYQHGDRKNILPCKHIFHKKCIGQWLNQHVACPLCRAVIEEDVLNSNYSNSNTDIDNNNNHQGTIVNERSDGNNDVDNSIFNDGNSRVSNSSVVHDEGGNDDVV